MYFNALFVLLFVCFLCNNSNGRRNKNTVFHEDYEYIKTMKAFYKIHTIPRNLWDAKLMCEQDGGRLFHPRNDSEAHAVLSLLNKTHRSLWTYFTALEVIGVFKTIDGGDDGGTEICVFLNKDGFFRIHDCFIPQQYFFICKKSNVSMKWNSECNMPDLDYNYNKQLDRCYKFHLKPMNWTYAYETCRDERSYLAVINSQIEADYLVELTKNAPKDQVLGNHLRGAVHLGFKRYNNVWLTIKGTSLNESGYRAWCPSQPDGGDQELCGSMFYSGLLNDIGCERRCFFICEHERIVASLPDKVKHRSPHLGGEHSIGKDHNTNQNAGIVVSSLNIFDILLPLI